MPREIVIASPRPLDLVDILAAAIHDGTDRGLRTLWSRGATQIVNDDEDAVLTVVKSVHIDSTIDVNRFGASPVPRGFDYITEAYYPIDSAEAAGVAAAFADAAGGFLVIGGDSL